MHCGAWRGGNVCWVCFSWSFAGMTVCFSGQGAEAGEVGNTQREVNTS